MRFVSLAEADQLHAEDRSHGSDQDALIVDAWVRQGRNRFQIGRTHLLSGKQQMNAASCFRSHGVNKHVDAGYVPIFQPYASDGLGDAVKIGAIHCQVDVFG